MHPHLKHGPRSGHQELLELQNSVGHQELEVQLDGVPKGWGDMSGCLDVVAENFTSTVETTC
jgi:hypothetical protein